MNKHLTIYTHAGHDVVLEKTLPAFQKEFDHVEVVSPIWPEDHVSRFATRRTHLSEHDGSESIHRARAGVLRAALHPVQFREYWFIEGDTVMLRPPSKSGPYSVPMVRAVLKEDEQPSGLVSPYYHPPWVIPGTLLPILLPFINLTDGGGHQDRWFSEVFRLARVLVFDQPEFFSQNYLNHDNHQALREAKANSNLSFVHGVKNLRDLEICFE
jgi:hypothetical protein